MKAIEYEGDKNRILSGKGTGETMAEILNRRFSRRGLVAAGSASVVVALDARATLAQTPEASPVDYPVASPVASPVAGESTLAFEGLTLQTGDATVVPEGYTAVPFLRWGDPLFTDSPAFDPAAQSAASQALQFGYNCDYIGWISLPLGSDSADHGLLVVNHEYTNPELMFAGYLTPNPEYNAADEESPEFLANPTQEIVDTELEAHGLSIVEVQRGADGTWSVVLDSGYNRRITATTPMVLTGPVAGAELAKTTEDPTGTEVIGTLNNCAGGTTPWGTVVSGEENFNQYFANFDALAETDPVKAIHDRFGLPESASERLWETFYPRFDLAQEPNEPIRFGWAVEIDPFDPASTPKKRTALGRAKHEGHTSTVAPSGHVAIYSGDDERFEYAYKFVTAGTYDAANREANLDLLDEGTLYVARFNDDGTGEWLPLVHGEGGLDEAAGFASQADILINPRAAADILGATKMDRPEDFETNPVNQKVYLVCTNNTNRAVEDNQGVDAANPRAENSSGHIIEITETDNDHASTTFTWDIFLLAGDPEDESTYFAGFPKDRVSPIASPDNITFDLQGNIWISTDGLPNSLDGNDGLFATPVEGSERGYLRQFFSSVTGAEVSGPVFNTDNTALFTAIQHPGEGGSVEEPITLWPDGEGVTRPTVVLITRNDGGPIGQ
jgi:secreted PhoX family phosphatase